jgi:TolB-like protein
VTDPGRVVFLSYASQDAQAAQKICEALRAAGIQVFLDQSELRGGDAWDQKIRHQIHDCVLFMPVVSKHTQERLEGYFRLEWKLAVDRSHLMATERPFLVPVVVDGTRDQEAFVPDAFRAVQWTRLPGGETPPAFVERIKRLLSPELSPLSAVSGAAPGLREPVRASRRSKPVLLAIVAVILATLAYFVADKFWISKHVAASTAFNPPPHSIAVLPFANMSGDKDQEYFSDGLTEEILNSLARISELRVSARTSSFSFKGKAANIGTIARDLNVGAILEGSVRRSKDTVRITAQLDSAVSGFHLWSQTYDRNLRDLLKVQTDIANAVASALKIKLLEDPAAQIAIGGTRNPAAFDAYLRGERGYNGHVESASDFEATIAAYSEAIRLDPQYALAFAKRSLTRDGLAQSFATGSAVRQEYELARQDSLRAIALAPELAEGHSSMGQVFQFGFLDFARAMKEYKRAVDLDLGNALVLRGYGLLAGRMGRADESIAALRHAVVLDPLNPGTRNRLGAVLLYARRYQDALAAYEEELSLDPDSPDAYAGRGLAYYALGNFQMAVASCERKPLYLGTQVCLAVSYDKLGRRTEAEAILSKYRGSMGDSGAYDYSTVYAQRGYVTKALEWLEIAWRLRDPSLVYVKTDFLLDPLRKETRFQAIERELKFP